MLSSRLPPPGPELVFYSKGKVEYERKNWHEALALFDAADKAVRLAEFKARRSPQDEWCVNSQ